MMPITTTTDFPTKPISFQRCPRDISMMCFPPVDPRPPANRIFLVQFEVDCEIEDDVHGRAVERARPELPAPDRVCRGLVETERQRLEHLHVRDISVLIDDALDDDDAGDAGFAGHFRIRRLYP